MYFSIVLFYKESENDSRFFEKKKYLENYTTLKFFFFLFNTEETQTFNFLYDLHVNGVFQIPGSLVMQELVR